VEQAVRVVARKELDLILVTIVSGTACCVVALRKFRYSYQAYLKAMTNHWSACHITREHIQSYNNQIKHQYQSTSANKQYNSNINITPQVQTTNTMHHDPDNGVLLLYGYSAMM
jgi:hypothetical protein